MKSKAYKILTAISAIIFISFLILRCSIDSFNSKDVKENISFLSSEEFAGRLCGSKENDNVSSYISETFKSLGLKPLDNDYKESFQVVTPVKNNTNAKLEITDSKKVFKEFEYGKDFKEDMLNFKVPNVTLSSEDSINISPSSISFRKGSDIFLFYVSREDNFNFRSSFVYESPISFAIAISNETYDYLLKGLKENLKISVTLPYKLVNTETFNVVGKIEGKNSKNPPLILTAHFDHMGIDCLNNVYCGALDNASGTAFLLELASYLSSLPKPNRDIIFVALNGEEFGLLGSKVFSSKYKDTLKDAKVINFDMIGAKNFPITFIRGGKSMDMPSPLLKDFENICLTANEDYNIKFEDSSDHSSFINNDFDALTISHSDVSKIHTPLDKVDNISTDSVDNVFKVVDNYLVNELYPKNKILIFNSTLHAISFILFLVLGSYPILKKLEKHKNSR
ncbi:M28 family metallopeptidase [Clostridium sp. Ade.TY]|uniref:M28 family metallopeptidase n=1 Tax=Clostridium sp. Ade.TY TaxID=1391647 RepID=UPI000426EC25|nr:M28 family metallopeptidase [Clostridium sp. Ade.TY]